MNTSTGSSSLYQTMLLGKTGSQGKFGFRQAVHDLQELRPYAEGEWLTLDRKEDESSTQILEKESDKSGYQVEGFEETVGKEKDEVHESEDPKLRKDNILRGPIWNYGMRKMSSDKEYYNNVLFGIPWSNLITPDDMILRGEKWIPSKPITCSLAVFIMKKLKKMNPTNVALVELETGRTLTYQELAEKVKSLASGLHWHGVQPNQVIGIVSYHSLEAHMLVLACLMVGAVVALIDSSLNPVDLSIVLRITNPNMLFTEVGKTFYKVEAAISYLEMSLHNRKPQLILNSTSMPESTHYILFKQLHKEVDSSEPTPGPRRADPLRPIMILYTGTSDNLRACLIPERYFTHSMAFVESVLPKTDEPCITVMVTPPMYCGLAIKTVLNHFVDGHRIVLCRGEIPQPCLITALRKFEVFAFLTIRSALTGLLDWPARPRCPHLKLVAVAGVPLRMKNLLRVHEELFKNQVQILQIYGIVELGTIAANTFLANKYGSVGKLFYNIEMKVLEEGTRLPLGVNQEGELCVRSPTAMLGYYNNPEANLETIDAEGFIHTGDLGYFDEQGYVHVTDHVREMIKWRTYLVSPSMVEEVLMEQTEIKEALVFGLFDEEDGELVTAAIIFEYGYENTDVFALEKRVNGLLPTHQKIRGGIHVFLQFPRSTVGKPMKEPVLKQVMERKLLSNQRRSSQ